MTFIHESIDEVIERLQQRMESPGISMSSMESPEDIEIPLVRQRYLPLYTNDLVSVQPMTGPTALIYYMRYRAGLPRERRPDIPPLPSRHPQRLVDWAKEGF